MARLGLLLLCFAGSVYAAGSDLANSQDPIGLERFPHSWIVDYSSDTDLQAREFITGRVDKTRRDIRAEHKIRTEARQQTATYRIADGTPRQEVIDHYVGLLGSEALFSCEGRDCGRSNDWANYIFRQAKLYGPDANQFYLAAQQQRHLVAVYIIEGGNKRVYAHVLVVDPDQPPPGVGGIARAGGGLAVQLTGKGYAVIDGVTPLANGSMSAGDEAALQRLAPELGQFSGQQIYVVCHLYGASGVARLLDAAERCSARAANLLTAVDGPEMVAFAAGPMLPRSALMSRIELVLPSRMRDE